MWGHIERATVRMQMCRGPGCPVRVRTGAGWIVRDGVAGRATCGSTADHLALWSRRAGTPTSVLALTARGKQGLTPDVSRIKPPYFCKFTFRLTLTLTLIPHSRLGVPRRSWGYRRRRKDNQAGADNHAVASTGAEVAPPIAN